MEGSAASGQGEFGNQYKGQVLVSQRAFAFPFSRSEVP